MLLDNITFGSNVQETETEIRATYTYDRTEVEKVTKVNPATGLEETSFKLNPVQESYEFLTEKKVPKTGLMLVGWGGNNGTTVTAGIIANREGLQWRTKSGMQQPNYYGSLTQASTVRVGNYDGEECFVPFNKLLPMVDPNDLVLGGWDISGLPLDQAMERAEVLDVDLQRKVAPYMAEYTPLPAIFDPAFVAENQMERADNILTGLTKAQQVEKIRQDLREFKKKNGLDKVLVLWTGNTERYSQIGEFNSTKNAFLKSLAEDHKEISPSSLYALACIYENVPFINGSPQNTFVPGLTEIAVELNSMLAGDDFKSGQTKMKSVLTDFLISAGIKPTSIVSYNHLGNNDGKNLSNPACFKSKEISKSDVVLDMLASNEILYPKDNTDAAKKTKNPQEDSAEKEKKSTVVSKKVKNDIDHCVVIKYIPYVGDSKRAMDEYTSEIFMGGVNTIVMHNTCEDSLLAAPLILDLVLLAEITGRIQLQKKGQDKEMRKFHPINVLLSYLTKAPFVPKDTPCINALNKQRAMVENIFKACVGLPPDNNMLLEFK